MDRNQAKEFYPILQAFAEGKVIECRTKPSTVEGTDVPNDWTEMKEIEYWNNVEYRIKPEPTYRPFANAEECWNEMLKHQPFGWIKCKEGYFNIVYVDDYYVGLADKDNSSILLASKNSYQDNIFADGTSTEKVGVTDCDTENVPYVNAASLWHDLKEEKPPLRKWVMFRYSGGGVNPTALHYGAMSNDVRIVTRGDGTQRIETLYDCYDKIEWFDFDELK